MTFETANILERILNTASNPISPERVKYYRKDNGWSQDVLARVSGLSLRTIQRVEKDGSSSVETQLALAAAFNVTQKVLFPVSSNLEVHWKRKIIMQNLLAIIVVAGAIAMLVILGAQLSSFIDWASVLYLVLFIYACTVVAFGAQGLIKSITGLRYLFSQDINTSPATQYLSAILKKQIIFAYGGALIGLLIGSIAIHTNVSESIVFHRAYAVNLLVLFYAAIFSEALLRPLTAKLDSRDIAQTSH